MEGTELVPNRGRRDDDEVEPQTRYSSEQVIAAAEITYVQNKKAEAIKNRERQGKLSKAEAKEDLKKAFKTLVHTMDKNAVEVDLATNFETGLTNQQYAAALEKWGENMLTPPKHDPWWLRLLKSVFGGFFNVLLWIGSVLCFVAFAVDASQGKPDQTNLYLGIVLAVVVTLSGLFSYYQEGKSADLMASLQSMNKTSEVTVFRNGQTDLVEPLKLVPGDVIEIRSGQAIPADVRVVSCSEDMEVNNASLTGESDPLKRDWRPEPEDMAPLESKNLMFFGTNLINGSGKCVVFATGDNTFMGRTAALATSTEGEDTPIAKEIKDFVLKVSFIAFTLGITFFIIGMVDTGNFIRNIIFLIGIIVANVPEGLLATVTVSLTLTAKRMFSKNVRVKNLESVETLGSTSVICSDKTGTLTTSVMTCQHVYYDLKECVADTRNPYASLDGDFYSRGKARRPDFLRLIRCGALCNNADFIDDPSNPNNGQVRSNANPTEAAMVKFASGHILAEYMLSVIKYRQEHKKLHEIPFNSTNKWQVSIHEIKAEYQIVDDEKKTEELPKGSRKALVQMKGAPERILDLCDQYWLNDELHELDESARENILKGVLALGGRGERVLALAELELDMKEFDLNVEEPNPNLKFPVEVDNSAGDKDAVFLEFEEQRMEIDLSNVRDDEGNKIQFEEMLVRHVGTCASTLLNRKYDSLRLFYGNNGRLAGDETFKALRIERGAVFHGFPGPYIFKGKNKDTMNWPSRRPIPGTQNAEQGLNFIGLYAMMDPPRPGVPEAVLKCQSAGIRVIMVTGDHPVTAEAIARQVNIISTRGKTRKDVANEKYGGNESMVKDSEFNSVVVPGWELQKVLDVEVEDKQRVADFWNETLKQPNVVFARTSPQQKLLIVTAVQQRGGIVAVTGDGVNDSPALKKADIGVAMGITGTDVAKEAADMILLDDNFASIVNGVEEGRIIFDNLKKSIAYTLSSNIPEIAPFLLYQTAGIPLPLTTVMILLVDLGTDLAPAISMAYEGREADIMSRPPRDPTSDKLVTWKLISFSYLQIGILQAIAGFYAYFVVLQSFGIFYSYTPGLDKDRVFEVSADKIVNRDAYFLWCFNKESCYYTPEFSFDWFGKPEDASYKKCVKEKNENNHCYYHQALFYSWQWEEHEATKGFRYNAKKLIVDTCALPDVDCGNVTLTMDMFNGKTNAGTLLVWNEVDGNLKEVQECMPQDTTDGKNAHCVIIKGETPAGPTDVTALLNFQNIWNANIEPYFRGKLLVSNAYPNRQCWKDVSTTYTETLEDKYPQPCDAITHPVKPRTFIRMPSAAFGKINANNLGNTRQYSLFPLGMSARNEALRRANTAYFISIIVVQWADLMICKTRIRSLFEQGMTNTFMNFSLLFETILGATISYLPLREVLGVRPLRFVWWNCAITFSLVIYMYDELRKGFIRGHKGSWLHRNTYW